MHQPTKIIEELRPIIQRLHAASQIPFDANNADDLLAHSDVIAATQYCQHALHLAERWITTKGTQPLTPSDVKGSRPCTAGPISEVSLFSSRPGSSPQGTEP